MDKYCSTISNHCCIEVTILTGVQCRQKCLFDNPLYPVSDSWVIELGARGYAMLVIDIKKHNLQQVRLWHYAEQTINQFVWCINEILLEFFYVNHCSYSYWLLEACFIILKKKFSRYNIRNVMLKIPACPLIVHCTIQLNKVNWVH